MKQIRPFVDTRLAYFCVFCDGVPDTRDHVPPRIFLDEPYPENLPVVLSCRSCNEGASLDEEYVACLLEVASCGSTNPTDLRRGKITRTLRIKPILTVRLANSLRATGKFVVSGADMVRVSRVVEKIARALWAFETGQPTGHAAVASRCVPVASLGAPELDAFRQLANSGLLPEVGSRMMFRFLGTAGQPVANSWMDVQAGRFPMLSRSSATPVGSRWFWATSLPLRWT